MQPDLRTGRQILDGLSLFRELPAGVAPGAELKDYLR